MSNFIDNNKYLTDNGVSVGNEGLLKLINDFVFWRIGQESQEHESDFIYSSDDVALEAAYAGPHYYAGIGIKGARSRKITIGSQTTGESPNTTTTYKFISSIGTPEEPNFWKDGGDAHYKDMNLKTNFLTDLEEIKNIVDDYYKVLKNIKISLEKIINNENEKFPDFMSSTIYDDQTALQNLMNSIEYEIGGNSLGALLIYFQSALGTEAEFDSRVENLKTILEGIETQISARLTSNYLDTVMPELKNWRLFWIKERIFKYTGSLVKSKGLEDALTQSQTERDAKEATLGVVFNTSNEWIKTPVIYATYYNPIVEEIQSGEVFEYNTTNRISLIHSGQEHATHYNIFRKILAQAEFDGFNNETQWDVAYKLTTTGEGEEYNDLYDLGTNNTFVYRIQAENGTSKSLQSDIISEEYNIIEVISSNRVKTSNLIEGYIFIDGEVNYILDTIEKEIGYELVLEHEIINMDTSTLNKVNCIAKNYFEE